MPAKTTTVPKGLIPYNAGVVVLTPLDANQNPDFRRSVMTQYNFLSSTQLSETRTTETLDNGNGQPTEYITNRVYNLAVTSNTLNIVFYNMVAGNIETLPDKDLMLGEFTWRLPSTAPDLGLAITFGAGKDHETEPAPDANGEYWFIVEDSFGNPLVRLDTAEFGAYSWDADTKELRFTDDYAGQSVRIMYRYEVTNSIRYASNPTLSQPKFQIDIYGERADAESDAKVKFHECLLRATPTGDLSGMATQQSRSAPITFNFQSIPVPDGVSVYYSSYIREGGIGDTTGAGVTNWVNGGDDKFDKLP